LQDRILAGALPSLDTLLVAPQFEVQSAWARIQKRLLVQIVKSRNSDLMVDRVLNMLATRLKDIIPSALLLQTAKIVYKEMYPTPEAVAAAPPPELTSQQRETLDTIIAVPKNNQTKRNAMLMTFLRENQDLLEDSPVLLNKMFDMMTLQLRRG